MPHIQDHDSAKGLEPHWGYADRVVPCVNDQGTCEYLDAVYHMHDLSMLYTFILWAVIGAILLTCLFARIVWRREEWRVGVALEKDLETSHSKTQQSPIHRLVMAILATLRHYLLPESFPTLFGHVSRVQVVILAAILIYLLIFS